MHNSRSVSKHNLRVRGQCITRLRRHKSEQDEGDARGLVAAANAYESLFNDKRVTVSRGIPCNQLESGIRMGRDNGITNSSARG
jgi:hypothetical protein